LQLPGVLARCAQQAISALLLSLIIYYFTARSLAWGWALTLFRPFYSLPKTSFVPSTWPTDIYLLVRCIYAGTLMNFAWAAGNTAFSVFMVREPLKNGNPLTSESKDANGSLLNGLKSKKLSIKVRKVLRVRLSVCMTDRVLDFCHVGACSHCSKFRDSTTGHLL
jgi:nucleoporin NDC1